MSKNTKVKRLEDHEPGASRQEVMDALVKVSVYENKEKTASERER